MRTIEATMTRGETDLSNITIAIRTAVGFGDGVLHAPEQTREDVHVLGETIKDNFLVDVNEDAGGVCMDGRGCEETFAHTMPKISPKCAGGPLQTAYAAAELVPGYFGSQTPEEVTGRIIEVGEILLAQGIVIGGHTTKGAIENEFKNPETGADQTGCGAQEKHTDSCVRVAARDHHVVATVDALTGIKTGSDYTYEAPDSIYARSKGYSPKAMLDIEAAQAEGTNEEVLVGAHEEVAVVWNWVKGTTVDRDSLIRELGKEVFVIDAWYIQDVAKAMASGRPDATTIYPLLERAAFEYQIATYAELCDGSHPVIVFQPEADSAA